MDVNLTIIALAIYIILTYSLSFAWQVTDKKFETEPKSSAALTTEHQRYAYVATMN